KAKEILDAGTLGEVYEVRTTDSFYNDFDPESMGWRANAATSGGGELIDTGYHPTYLMLHLAGAVPTSAFAMLSTHRLKFMEGEDSAQVLVRFDSGAVGQMVTSWAYQAAPGTDRFSVVGEKGSLSSDGSTLRVQVRGEEEQVFEHEQVETFSAEIAHFVDCLIAGERPINTEVEGVSVLGVILAAYESSRTGKMAEVTGPGRRRRLGGAPGGAGPARPAGPAWPAPSRFSALGTDVLTSIGPQRGKLSRRGRTGARRGGGRPPQLGELVCEPPRRAVSRARRCPHPLRPRRRGRHRSRAPSRRRPDR